MTEELFRNTQVSMKVAALHFMDLPLSVYYSLPQVKGPAAGLFFSKLTEYKLIALPSKNCFYI